MSIQETSFEIQIDIELGCLRLNVTVVKVKAAPSRIKNPKLALAVSATFLPHACGSMLFLNA